MSVRASRLSAFLKGHKIIPRGVVYAGAHVGENVRAFLETGFKHILALEPDPAAFTILESHRREGQVECLQVAVTETDSPCEYFRFAGVPMINSATEPNWEYWQELLGDEFLAHASREPTRVEGRCLDSILASRGSEFNALYLNIQGGEYAAIRGAERTLARFDCILSEVNFSPRYKHAPMFYELNDIVQARGFVLMALQRYPAGQHGDAWYVRKDIMLRRRDQERERFTRAYLDQVHSLSVD